MTVLQDSMALAEDLLASLRDRWVHVKAVAAVAEGLAVELNLDRNVLGAAALLHDVGYAPKVRTTGFHPLDGARYLDARGVSREVATLVANHSCAIREAKLRGLDEALLNEFPPLDTELADALCFADMTTGPQGQPMRVGERLAEIRSRYGPNDLVARFVTAAEPELTATVVRVERRLSAAQSR